MRLSLAKSVFFSVDLIFSFTMKIEWSKHYHISLCLLMFFLEHLMSYTIHEGLFAFTFLVQFS
jgi:hypothetical protein